MTTANGSTLDARSRVTVVGTRRRVDVAVPTTAPIGEYVAQLAELCGQDRPHPLPASWSLARAGAPVLPLDASLAAQGVLDGEVLYLRDAARDPGAEPIVDDVEELVTEHLREKRATSLPVGLVVVGFGLVWTVVTAAFAVRNPGGLLGPAVVLALLALVLIATSWALHQRSARVPAGLRLSVGLAAVPCLAVAGALLAGVVAAPEYAWCGAIAGANAAALLALAAIPEAIMIAIEVQFAAAGLIIPLLLIAEATLEQAAAAVVIVGLALIGSAKLQAASIAAWIGRPRRQASVAHAVTELLIRSDRLLAAVVAIPALALAAAFVVLAMSGGGYALALTGVAAVALLVRARQRGFTSEVVLIGGAGMVGLFALATALLVRHGSATLALAVLATAGALLLAFGVALTFARPEEEPSAPPPGRTGDVAALLVGTAVKPNRLRFLDIIGMLCHLWCATLALGVFGVLADLVLVGRQIVD